MNRYNQSEVISIVSGTLPLVRQNGGDPHAAFLKRAEDLNLPPSVLERCGQMYNTAKTLNYLDRVGVLEKRGASFQTLDVPRLVEAYTAWKGNQPTVKRASVEAVFDHEDEYRLPRALNPLRTEPEVQKQAEAPAAPEPSELDLYREARALKTNAETLRKIARDTDIKIRATLNNWVDAYRTVGHNLPNVRTLADQTYALEKTAAVKTAGELLVAQLEARGDTKRFTELQKQAGTLFRRSQAHESLQKLAALVDTRDAADSLAEEYEDLLKKKASYLGNLGFESHTSKSKPTSDIDKKLGEALSDDKTTDPSESKPPKRVYIKNVKGDKGDKGDRGTDGTSGITTVVERPVKTPVTERKDKDGTSLGEWLDKHVPRLDDVLGRAMDSAGGAARALGQVGDFTSRITLPAHQRAQTRVDTAAQFARAEAALNTLLLVDPIISEYDEDEMRDIFFTVLDRNPRVASDINLLRSVLRQAGQFEGVDLETAKQLQQLDRPAGTKEEKKDK